jgi:hypothetical protein
MQGDDAASIAVLPFRRLFARLFRRPDLGPVDIAKMLPLAYVVAVGLMIMGAVLIYADIVKPFSLSG